MAAGVRIQHPTERNATFLLVDGRRPYVQPIICAACGGKTHTFKTYHLRLDDTGACIVSTEIVTRLQSLPLMGGFRVVNEVAEPPAQRLAIAKPVSIDRVPIVGEQE